MFLHSSHPEQIAMEALSFLPFSLFPASGVPETAFTEPFLALFDESLST